jgi:hypothetical protein
MNLIGELLLQKMCTISPEQLFMIAYILRRIYIGEIRAFEKCVQIQQGWQTDSSFIHSHMNSNNLVTITIVSLILHRQA